MLQFLEINYCLYDLLSILELFTWIDIVKIKDNFVNYAITIIKWKILAMVEKFHPLGMDFSLTKELSLLHFTFTWQNFH